MAESISEGSIEQEISLNQEEILDLLIEASSPHCRNKRVEAIQTRLSEAARMVWQDEAVQPGVQEVLKHAFAKLIRDKTDVAPNYLPTFVILCNRDKYFEKINWALISQVSSEVPRFISEDGRR